MQATTEKEKEMQVDNTVLAVLSRAHVQGNALSIAEQLDRTLYARTNKVLEAAGGKWNRKAQAHIFDADAASRIDEIILTGSVVVPKDDFNFFPTPPAVIERMLLRAGIRPGMRVLEPSAGRGAIAFACAEQDAEVDCYELMEANYLAIAGDARLASVQQMDFLTVDPEPRYSRAIMNPPFAKQADIIHVQHALKFLEPTGLLVSVMAGNVEFRDNKLTRDFRDLVERRGGVIEALPDGSFKSSGTQVRTVLVTIPYGE
jgi:predicted RNA methylase